MLGFHLTIRHESHLARRLIHDAIARFLADLVKEISLETTGLAEIVSFGPYGSLGASQDFQDFVMNDGAANHGRSQELIRSCHIRRCT